MIILVVSVIIASIFASLCCKPQFRYVNIEQIDDKYYLKLYFRRGLITFSRYNNGYNFEFGHDDFFKQPDDGWSNINRAEEHYGKVIKYFQKNKDATHKSKKSIIKSSRDKIKIEEPEFNNPQIEKIVTLSIEGRYEEAREIEKELILQSNALT